MDPINPWLDTEEVRRLAQRLLQPIAQAPVDRNDMGFNDSFVGFSSDDAEPQHQAPEISQPTVSGVSLPRVMPAPDKFQDFRRELRQKFGVEEFFILNWEGSAIYDPSGMERFYFLARHTRRINMPHSHVRIKLRSNTSLEVIPAGGLVMGALTQNPIRPNSVAEITTALGLAFAS